MALTLDSTVAGHAANSYVSLDYLKAYWTNHFNQTVALQLLALSDPMLTQLLVRACGVIETVRFTGSIQRSNALYRYSMATRTVIDVSYLSRSPQRYDVQQKLQFPRNLDVMLDSDAVYYVPEPIMMAQCEQAAYLLNYDETAVANRLQGVSLDRTGIGNGAVLLTQEYFGLGTSLSPSALDLLRPFIYSASTLRRG